MRVLIFGIALAGLAGCGGTTVDVPLVSSGGDLGTAEITTGTVAALTTEPIVADNDASFALILNSYRDNLNVGHVVHEGRLDAAAQDHAQDMVDNNYFSHISQDGRTALDRILAAGYEPNAYGENLAGRQQNEQEAMDAWINSDSHRAVLDAATFQDFGLGLAGSGSMTRWVLIMGREKQQ